MEDIDYITHGYNHKNKIPFLLKYEQNINYSVKLLTNWGLYDIIKEI